MGIRVVCPNGHRMNLKSHLAGRHGLCPECNARFRIPYISSDDPQPLVERSNDERLTERQQDSAKAVATEDFSDAPFLLDSPEASTSPNSTLGTSIDDFTMDAVWYVQAPTGERYGPASSEIMLHWIDEGRVQPNYHVWRDGWSEWQPASTILTLNRSTQTTNVAVVEGAEITIAGHHRSYSHSKTTERSATLFILLSLVGLILAGGIALAFYSGQLSFGN